MKLTDDFDLKLNYDFKTKMLEIKLGKENIEYDEIEDIEDVGNSIIELLYYLEDARNKTREIEKEVESELMLEMENKKEEYIRNQYKEGQE